MKWWLLQYSIHFFTMSAPLFYYVDDFLRRLDGPIPPTEFTPAQLMLGLQLASVYGKEEGYYEYDDGRDWRFDDSRWSVYRRLKKELPIAIMMTGWSDEDMQQAADDSVFMFMAIMEGYKDCSKK